MNNIGENIHKQVIDIGVLPILVKIVKKKVCSSSVSGCYFSTEFEC